MNKDFDKWNTRKVKIDSIEGRPFFHVGEVWSCYLGINVGYEQDGKGDDFLRPIVIIKKFGKETFWGIPLTTKEKKERPYFFTFTFVEGVKSTATLSQLRLIDARRLAYKIGQLHEKDASELRKKLKELLP
jgi:mRNA interferase MazF